MKFIVQRAINGISLNGLETALDENGNALLFDSEEKAKDFLKMFYKSKDMDKALDEGSLQINQFDT